MIEELKIRKNTEKEIKRIQKILNERKYPNLSKIMLKNNGKENNLTIFLFDFLRYFDKRRKERKKIKANDPYYKNTSIIDIPLYCNEKEIQQNSIFNGAKNGQVKVSRCINILVTLGLIEKKNPYIEKDLISLHKNKKRKRHYVQTGKNYRQEIFLNVPSRYSKEILIKAEKRACKLLDSGYRYGDFSKDIVKRTFGQSFADKIFLDKRETNTQQKEQQKCIKIIINQMLEKENFFHIEEIKEKVYSIEELKVSLYSNYNKNIGYIRRCIDIEKNKLLKENLIDYRELTKEEKQKYGISSRKKYIIKKEVYNERKTTENN